MTEKTLHDALQEYLEHLKACGKSERTLYTYSKDAEQIEAHFGLDKKLGSILIPHVSGFLKSDALLKMPSGKERSEPTVRKPSASFGCSCAGRWSRDISPSSRFRKTRRWGAAREPHRR